MDRKVDIIIAEWRELERRHDAATDDDAREYIEARISEVREEHRRAVHKRMPLDEDSADRDGALGASV